jgi:hypothetical protein
LQRAPRAGTVALRNPVSCDPVWERGRFLGALYATTDEFFITDAREEDVFPNEDFFPDIDNLFGDMSLTDDNTKVGFVSALAPTPYVFLRLAIDLDMLDMFCSYRSLVNMVILISIFLAIFC